MRVRSRLGVVALLGGLLAVSGCDDEEGSEREVDDSAAQTGDEDAGPRPQKDAAVDPDDDAAVAEQDGGSAELDASGEHDAGETPDAAPGFPTLPDLLSLSGCNALQVPALCSLSQTDGTFSANCAGTTYTGTIGLDRALTFTRPDTTNADGAKVSFACSGLLQVAGVVSADCKMTTDAAGDKPASEAACKLTSDKSILPGVACMELPAQLTDVVLCKEGAAADGTTIDAGTCKILQDGCAFQAECAGNLTLAGTVSRTGLSFTRKLRALADAATPATGVPAFVRGAEVNHNCTGAIAEGKLTGSCSAGGIRGTAATSVCSNEGNAPALPACGLIAPTHEHLFVLDSCDLLKQGEGQTPGIGEPVCAFRQNNCIWDVQCGNDPLTKFSGRISPGATKVDFRLLTGTPCDLTFDAAGVASGKCTVPGQTACPLSSKPAVAGTATCPALPANTDPRSNGCGGGDPLACRGSLQHGCNYMGICQFAAANPDVVIAGTTSLEAGRPHFQFNGVGDYKCYVNQATAAEIASGDRAANEWYGQCMNSVGGMCRDNYNPTTGTGFRGLRIYFDPITPPAP